LRFPHYKQLDSMDCGPTCLKIIAKSYGKNLPLYELRHRCSLSRRGVSLLGISDAAETIGFRTHGVQLTFDQLIEHGTFPCVVHWNQNHFVVAYGVKRNRKKLFTGIAKSDVLSIQVSDPAMGLLEYRKDEFIQHWASSEGEQNKGIALLFDPTPDFYTQDETETQQSFFRVFQYLIPYKKFVLQLVLSIVAGSIIGACFPFLTQGIVDEGIGAGDLHFVTVILIAQLLLLLGQIANEYLRNVITLHITARISISLISDFLSKIMKLPISFFESRATGDIMKRIDDHQRIQSFLTVTVISIVFSLITFFIYTIVLATYSAPIFLVFLTASTVYIFWTLLFLRRRKEIDYKMFHHTSLNQSSLIQLVVGMQEIKLNNIEKQKRWQWERIQTKLFKLNLKSLFLNQNQQVGATLIDQSKNLIISFLAASAVIEGSMSLGIMMAIQYILGQLSLPVQRFIGFVQSAQDAMISLERLHEVQKLKNEDDDDIRVSSKELSQIENIALRNINYSYGTDGSPALADITFNIPAGKITAIVGSSGSGKTTLIKLLLGFYKPTSGKILINNTNLSNHPPGRWRMRCGAVLQDGFIFADTIRANIVAGVEADDTDRLEKAMGTACIAEYVDSIPMGLNAKIGEDGLGLSTGQKQRILIARAVYKNPDLLFFDEATNALDAKNERMIMANLNTFFKNRTVVVVAHRLSTVKHAHQIVALDKGLVMEIGTHEELLEKRGFYFSLVRDQLQLAE
jgi:ATP-binding cassette subfamily B protein